MILAHLVVLASATLASARLPTQFETRAYTGPGCNATYQWTDNEQNISPCNLAATVYGACAGPTWNIPALIPGDTYNPPAGSFVTQCSCSWLAYNLISACTVCQGLEQGLVTWPDYTTNCSGSTSSTYFPSTQVLPDGTSIPWYAVTDPTQWPDERFDLDAASAIHASGHADLVYEAKSHKSTPVGAIAGGVVGGLAVILLAAGLAFYIYRKKQKNPKIMAPIIDDGHEPEHKRTLSDLSQKSNGIGYGYQRMDGSFMTSPSSQLPTSPTSGTMHTHSSSVNSLSYFGSVNHSVAPYGSSASPPPRTLQASPLSPTPYTHTPNQHSLDRENIIVPFTLAPSTEAQSRNGSQAHLPDRKRADGAIIPVYDSPNSLPPHAVPVESLGESASGQRARFNPPAYSAVDEASVISTRARQAAHSKKGSGDTQFSIDSTTSGGAVSAPRHSGVGGSISAIDDVIGQMGLTQDQQTVDESVSGSGGTLGTGFSRQLIRNQPFRPGNPDP